MSENLKKEEVMLCRLLTQALHTNSIQNNTKENLLTPEEWKLLIDTAERHKVLSLLYDVLEEQKNLGAPERERLEKRSRQTVKQSYRLLFLSRFVLDILKENGLDAVLLKGVATAGFYPVPELRKSGDVDLLVNGAKEAVRAAEILEKYGFQRTEKQNAHHHIVCDSPDGISVEIHSMLAEPFDNDAVNRYLEQLLPEYFIHRSTETIMGVEFLLPDAPYHAFYLLLHMLQHFLRSGFGMKLLCDWVVFWEKENTSSDKEVFLRLVSESGTGGFAWMITTVCVQELGLCNEHVAFLQQTFAPERTDEKERSAAFLKEVLEAEEFGKSSVERMVVLRGTGCLDYMREFHHQMKLTYPKAGRCVLLFPVLWVMTLVGFLYRNRTLRKVSGRAILQKAGKRSRLMKQMHLFERT